MLIWLLWSFSRATASSTGSLVAFGRLILSLNKINRFIGHLIVALDAAVFELDIEERKHRRFFALQRRQYAVYDVGESVAADSFGAGAHDMQAGVDQLNFIQYRCQPEQRG